MPVLPVVARNCVRFSLQFAKMNGGILCQVSFLLYVCKKLWMNTLFQKTEVKVSNSHGWSSEYFALWCCRIVGSLEQSLQWISRNRKWSKVPQFLTYHNLMAQIQIYLYQFHHHHHTNINTFNGKVSKACIFQRNSFHGILGNRIAWKLMNILWYQTLL